MQPQQQIAENTPEAMDIVAQEGKKRRRKKLNGSSAENKGIMQTDVLMSKAKILP
jgi:hypothetical protein